jgi:hypothetical protein
VCVAEGAPAANSVWAALAGATGNEVTALPYIRASMKDIRASMKVYPRSKSQIIAHLRDVPRVIMSIFL